MQLYSEFTKNKSIFITIIKGVVRLKYLLAIFFIFTVFLYSQDSTKILDEEELEHETEEIIINATRSTRTIENEPTRVEFIGAEELDEKISMDPSGISMILNESTGIQVQQTSPFSADNTFRIHGLPGRYTQLLKDGFPLYSGLSSSLSLQSNIDLNEHFLVELGSRLDYNKDYNFFFLPRVSLLYKWTDKFTTRLSSGLGYLLPRLSDTHDRNTGIYFLDKSIVEPERSYGFNFDFNYNTALSDDAAFSINQLFVENLLLHPEVFKI